MKILVTGGAGFIGSEFARQLVSLVDNNLVIVDSLSYAGSLKNISDIREKVRFVKLDIRDKLSLLNLFSENEFTHVVNFAAETHVDNSIHEPSIFAQTNIIGTSNLLEACLKFESQLFFQISTDEVYGSTKVGKFVETDQLKPSSPYSASKASAELLVTAFAHTYSINTQIARCSNNFGPAQFPEKLIPVAIKKLTMGAKVPLYGNGMNIREWIFVTDTCKALINILFSNKYNQIYNISSGIFKTNLEVISELSNILGIADQQFLYVQDRAGHDYRYAIDSSKIKDEFGWQPNVNFRDGLNETVKWYKDNNGRFSEW